MLPSSEKIDGYTKALGNLLKTISAYIPIVVAFVFIVLYWTERRERLKYYEDAQRSQQQSIQFIRESRDLVREASEVYSPERYPGRNDYRDYPDTSRPVDRRK